MPLRRRLALIAAASVAVAILFAALACYLVVRSQLRSQVDSALTAQSVEVQRLPRARVGAAGHPGHGGRTGAVRPDRARRPVRPSGARAASRSRSTTTTLTVAGGQGSQYLERRPRRRQPPAGADHASHDRVSAGASVPAALQLARPLNGVDHVLSSLRLILAVLLAGRHRAGRRARSLRRPPRAGPARRGGRGRPAHLGDRRPHPPHPGARRRRGRPAGHPLQPDARPAGGLARRARRVGAGPAPAGGRRLARAAHAGDQPAHQHRGAAGRAASSSPRTAGACWPTSSSRARS